MHVNRITTRDLEATERRAQGLRRGDTSICEAIGLIVSRLATLSSDELYERPGYPGGPGTDRILAEYRDSYRKDLEGALALLVESEDVYQRQREDIRKIRRETMSQGK